jgi:hypothetical protein
MNGDGPVDEVAEPASALMWGCFVNWALTLEKVEGGSKVNRLNGGQGTSE